MRGTYALRTLADSQRQFVAGLAAINMHAQAYNEKLCIPTG
jgi:hypothetical protein